MAVTFSQAKIRETSMWLAHFRQDWDREIPIKIHAYGTDEGHGLGGPPFHKEFENWLGAICFCGRKRQCAPGCSWQQKGDRHLQACDPGCPSPDMPKQQRNHEARLRTTRAFRKLRKVAPREFDALYLMCALGASFYTTLQAFNDRAERLNKPERYAESDLMVLIVSGIDKVCHYY